MIQADSVTAYRPSPAPAPTKVSGRKAGRLWTALSAACVLLMVLVVAGIVVYARGGASYLGLARPVAFGTQITDSDLIVVRVSAGGGLSPIPASERKAVLGKYAAAPLFAGTLLTRDQLADTAIAEGKQLVTISQKADRAPAEPLTPGAPVLVIRTPGNNVISGADAQSPIGPVPGVVRTVRTLEYGAGYSVDVLVDADTGPAVAMAAATGDVTLVGTAR